MAQQTLSDRDIETEIAMMASRWQRMFHPLDPDKVDILFIREAEKLAEQHSGDEGEFKLACLADAVVNGDGALRNAIVVNGLAYAEHLD